MMPNCCVSRETVGTVQNVKSLIVMLLFVSSVCGILKCTAWVQQQQQHVNSNSRCTVMSHNFLPSRTAVERRNIIYTATKEDTDVSRPLVTSVPKQQQQQRRRQSRSSLMIEQQVQKERGEQQQQQQMQQPQQQQESQQEQKQDMVARTIAQGYIDEEAPAGIVGAEFFGGNKEKEEFFDPIAEAEVLLKVVKSSNSIITTTIPTIDDNPVGVLLAPTSSDVAASATIINNEDVVEVDSGYINRFTSITGAFDCTETSNLARDIQHQINLVLYDDSNSEQQQQQYQQVLFPYSKNLQWDTPFSKTTTTTTTTRTNNPLDELAKSFDFYRRIDVAIIAGTKVTETSYKLQFEIAITWPTIWEPRILLTGTSHITLDLDTNEITHQQDVIDGESDLVSLLTKQLIPRFWDLYHIGVAPSAEINPRYDIKSKNLLATYKLYSVPPRIYLQPTILESSSNRVEQNTAFIPNHAFSCSIVTMGPLKQRYSTTSQITVAIQPLTDGGPNNIQLQWEIPLSVEYLSNTNLCVPSKDEDSMINPANQQCQYVYRARRIFATIPYFGNSPQDETIADARKKLYQKVVLDDGYQPALDVSGRTKFVFIQNNVKACFTEDGFGMSIYDWRPQFAAPNEIGLELIDTSNMNKIKIKS